MHQIAAGEMYAVAVCGVGGEYSENQKLWNDRCQANKLFITLSTPNNQSLSQFTFPPQAFIVNRQLQGQQSTAPKTHCGCKLPYLAPFTSTVEHPAVVRDSVKHDRRSG
jgi:hypothetical protein